jgi:hypothetical protein
MLICCVDSLEVGFPFQPLFWGKLKRIQDYLVLVHCLIKMSVLSNTPFDQESLTVFFLSRIQMFLSTAHFIHVFGPLFLAIDLALC